MSSSSMARGMARGELVPLFCGSGETCYGTRALLKKMVELFPHPGEAGGECGGAALEVRAGAADAVRIDHDAGIAVGDVVAEDRRHDRLIVDAGIRHDDAELQAGGDEAALFADRKSVV